MPNSDYGILIRNGVNFSHDTAESVSYDNTSSGLSATDIQAAVDELAQGGGGTGGHTIIDDDGTSMTTRSGLQFKGSHVEDDSTDARTVVNVVREMTEEQRSDLPTGTDDGFIFTTDNPSSFPLTTDFVAYRDGKSVTQMMDYYDFTITTTWTANSNMGDYETYPYKQTIATTIFSNDSCPEADVLSATPGGFMTEDERADKDKICQEVLYNTTGITLLATDQTSNALTLRVRGV